MLKKSSIAIIAFALLAALFFAGVLDLLNLRFDQGDVYPYYSTLRADPLGSKVFYEAAAALPGISVSRLDTPLDPSKAKDRVLFLLGTRLSALRHVQEKDFSDLRQFLFGGGRVVISLFPELRAYDSDDHKSKTAKPKKSTPSAPDEKKKRKMRKSKDDLDDALFVSFEEKFGLKFEYKDLLADEDGSTRGETAGLSLDETLPPKSIPWHSAIYFSKLNDQWRTVYQRNKLPVIIERQYGAGSIVLLSDSYCISNEGLGKRQYAGLLAWLIGANHNLIFDETHLGIESRPGVAGLARGYGLTGLAASLLVLGILFIWKNSVSLAPPHDNVVESDNELVLGKDSASGFANLLRRSISPADILNVCFVEWKKNCARPGSRWHGKAKAMEEILARENAMPASGRRPVACYREMSAALRKTD